MVGIVDLCKRYTKGKETITIFDRLNLAIPRGDFVAVMGPSGSGKTTLLNLLGGIDRADAGEIEVAGERLDRLSESELSRWRASHIGFIFQFYNLMPMLTAAQNVELPLLLTRLGRKERRQRVETALGVVGLADRVKHYPKEMSGGQQQRVAIARAIVSDPALLLCDEPTGDLDRDHRRRDPVDPASAQPGSRQDDRDGDPRPGGGAIRQAIAASRQGPLHREGARGVNDLILIRKNLFRRKLRAILMIVSILIAFAIFGVLASFERAFNAGQDRATPDRLVVVNKISFTQPLPISYYNRVAAIDGVAQISHFSWFGGYYQEPKNFLVAFAVDPENWMKLRDTDFVFSPEARAAFIRERTGVLVGARMMEKWGWKVGDHIPISSNIWSQKNGVAQPGTSPSSAASPPAFRRPTPTSC